MCLDIYHFIYDYFKKEHYDRKGKWDGVFQPKTNEIVEGKC